MEINDKISNNLAYTLHNEVKCKIDEDLWYKVWNEVNVRIIDEILRSYLRTFDEIIDEIYNRA